MEPPCRRGGEGVNLRDKLFELIEKAGCVSGFGGQLADFLIANGVVVLPIQPEQVVYETTEFLDGTPSPEIYHYSDWWVNVGLDHENGGYMFLYDSVRIYHSDIGKTLFLSLEEAEKSLKEEPT